MRRIGVGVVGAGWMGATMLKRLSERADVQILSLCETNRDRAESVLGGLGISPDVIVSDYDALIANPDVDAVWIVSPNRFHAAQSLAAMRAGKHVFCEKPCATTFSEYLDLMECEQAHPELITYVDYILSFDTMEMRLKDMVSAGEFGEVTQIQVNYRHPVNIDGDKAWKLDKNMMGDAIGMGINHAISVMLNLMSSQGHPVSVYATSAQAKVRGFEADPIWNIQIRFSGGATGFCFGNIDNGCGYDAYHNIYGTGGGFVFDSQLPRDQKVRYWSARSTDGRWIYPLSLTQCRQDGCEHLLWPADTTTPDSGNVVEHQTAECVGHFMEGVKSGTKSPLSFVNSSAVAEVGWAAMMSAVTSKAVALPLAREEARAFFAAQG